MLRALMAEQDVRAEEIAYKLGVSASTVARWMAGKTQPTPGMSVRLADLFDVDRKTFKDSDLMPADPDSGKAPA